jgi:hypothetical protein
MSLWTQFRGELKTRLSAVARSMFFSRGDWKKAARCRKLENKDIQAELAAVKKERDVALKKLSGLERENEALRREVRTLQNNRTVELPEDPQLPFHQFGPRMISLCVNIAQTVGLRPAARALKMFFEWLGVNVRIPTWQGIRSWMQRIGIARIEKVKKRDGWIWIVDHSVQLGKEKVLLIMGIHPDNLPAPGKTLRLAKMVVLACEPGTLSNQEAVAAVYQKTADKLGVPRAILADGAPELRNAVEGVNWPEKCQPIVLRDFKHYLANRVAAHLKKDDYVEYLAQIGKTRNAIPLTELSCLMPPCTKSKARFMNLKPYLEWGKLALWCLDHPKSLNDEGITPERLNEKLGWVRLYDKSLERWDAYQEVISTCLTWINHNGLSRGSADKLKTILDALPGKSLSQRLIKDAIDFVLLQEAKLKRGERLWLSTEIIESTFGIYKQFEGQHSKGGFTALLSTLPALLKDTTPKEVTTHLSQVTVKKVQTWLSENLPTTNQAKRRKIKRRYRNSLGSDCKENSATKTRLAA